jgi:signal transduction histidine kinase
VTLLLRLPLRYEQDVVLARQRARDVAALVGFDGGEQTRLATAVSEIARNAFRYAREAVVEIALEPAGAADGPGTLVLRVRDQGPGIADLQAVLDGRYESRTGMGLGIVGARRLVDAFEIESAPSGTSVVLTKRLPGTADGGAREAARIIEALTRRAPASPFEELQRQNQELLHTMAELRARQLEIERLNQELAETNRGVLALYAELDARADYLDRANELKTRFLSDLSHELRTPLNAVRNLSRLLLDGYEGPLTEGQVKAIGMMRRSADGLAELVDDWLDIAKIEAGKITMRLAPFDTADVFATLRGLFRPLVTSESVTLAIDEPPPGVPTIVGDEAKVAQILRNFVSNALKFTERGEVRVWAECGPGDTVRLSVRDTGIGIAPEDQARIFEEFTQVDSPVQRRVKGTGLGLPLSRKLANLLGGDVLLASTPGAGSVFTLVIPRLPPDSLAPVADGAAPELYPGAARRPPSPEEARHV